MRKHAWNVFTAPTEQNGLNFFPAIQNPKVTLDFPVYVVLVKFLKNTSVSRTSFCTQITPLQSCALRLYAFLPPLIGWVKWRPAFYDFSIFSMISPGRELRWGQDRKCIHALSLVGHSGLPHPPVASYLPLIHGWPYKNPLQSTQRSNYFLLFSSSHCSLILCGT